MTEMVDATMSSDGLSGFCGLTDSSMSFWLVILRSRLSENPASAHKIASRIVSWLGVNWNMRKLGHPPDARFTADFKQLLFSTDYKMPKWPFMPSRTS